MWTQRWHKSFKHLTSSYNRHTCKKNFARTPLSYFSQFIICNSPTSKTTQRELVELTTWHQTVRFSLLFAKANTGFWLMKLRRLNNLCLLCTTSETHKKRQIQRCCFQRKTASIQNIKKLKNNKHSYFKTHGFFTNEKKGCMLASGGLLKISRPFHLRKTLTINLDLSWTPCLNN